MARQPRHDPAFDIAFFEAIHSRVPGYVDVIELLGGLYTKTGRIADGLRMDRKLVRLHRPRLHRPRLDAAGSRPCEPEEQRGIQEAPQPVDREQLNRLFRPASWEPT
jgi:hypothetical protein